MSRSKQLIKTKVKGILYKFRKNKNAVFLYHEINDQPSRFAIEHYLNVTPANFENQIKWIIKNYKVVDPLNLTSQAFLQQEIAEDSALITFDDGSSSIIEFAVPILRKYGIKALLFLNASPCLGERFWSGLVTYLSSRDLLFADAMKQKYGDKNFFLKVSEQDIDSYSIIAKLETLNQRVLNYTGKFVTTEDLEAASDCLLVGNHLYDHFNAASVKPDLLRSQYLENFKLLSKMTNGMPDIFSYPFGQPEHCYNKETDQVMKSLGARKIFYANSSNNSSLSNTFLYRVGVSDRYSESYMRSICC